MRREYFPPPSWKGGQAIHIARGAAKHGYVAGTCLRREHRLNSKIVFLYTLHFPLKLLRYLSSRAVWKGSFEVKRFLGPFYLNLSYVDRRKFALATRCVRASKKETKWGTREKIENTMGRERKEGDEQIRLFSPTSPATEKGQKERRNRCMPREILKRKSFFSRFHFSFFKREA